MTSTGTVGQTVFPINKITEMAYRRAGIASNVLTSEHAMIARDLLFVLTSEYASRGVKLFRLEKKVLGVYPGTQTYQMPVGTVDIENVNYRTISRVENSPVSSAGGSAGYAVDEDISTIMTQTAPLGNFSVDAGGDVTIMTVGLLPGATSTMALVFETSPDNVTWTTRLVIPSQTFTDGVWSYFDIDYSYTTQYARLRATSGTIVMREIVFGNGPNEIPYYRMNKDDYWNLVNKQQPSQRSLQYWFDRQDTPLMRVWPPPNNTWDQIVALCHMQMEDIGVAANTLAIPQRWYNPIIATLARGLCLEAPGADLKKFDMLDADMKRVLLIAEEEERDNSPIFLSPNISPYTR